MGRLIDTDDLVRYLSYEDTEEMIDCIPTAYDFDGVLERLEEEKNPMYRDDGTLMAARTEISINKAIEIVKGGVNDEKKECYTISI